MMLRVQIKLMPWEDKSWDIHMFVIFAGEGTWVNDDRQDPVIAVTGLDHKIMESKWSDILVDVGWNDKIAKGKYIYIFGSSFHIVLPAVQNVSWWNRKGEMMRSTPHLFMKKCWQDKYWWVIRIFLHDQCTTPVPEIGRNQLRMIMEIHSITDLKPVRTSSLFSQRLGFSLSRDAYMRLRKAWRNVLSTLRRFINWHKNQGKTK